MKFQPSSIGVPKDGEILVDGTARALKDAKSGTRNVTLLFSSNGVSHTSDAKFSVIGTGFVAIEVRDNAFSTKRITVIKGTTISWAN